VDIDIEYYRKLLSIAVLFGTDGGGFGGKTFVITEGFGLLLPLPNR